MNVGPIEDEEAAPSKINKVIWNRNRHQQMRLANFVHILNQPLDVRRLGMHLRQSYHRDWPEACS